MNLWSVPRPEMPGMRRAFFFVFFPLAPASGGRGPPDQVGLIQPRPNAISPRPEPHRPSPSWQPARIFACTPWRLTSANSWSSPSVASRRIRSGGAMPRLKPLLRAVFSASWPTTLEPEFRTRIVIERKTRGSVMQTEGLAKSAHVGSQMRGR